MTRPIHSLLVTKRGSEEIKLTLAYNFIDCSSKKIDELMQSLVKTAEQGAHSDEDYLNLIFEWYANIPAQEKKFSMSRDVFQDVKATKLAQHISKALHLLSEQTQQQIAANQLEVKQLTHYTKPFFKSAAKKEKLLDVGAGDGVMSDLVSQKLGFIPTGVDVTEEGAKEWCGIGAESKLNNINLVIYDGKNLREALKKDTHNFTNLYSVVMFNHVLHHFPSFDGQVSGLQQAISLLKENGVLLISEHANLLMDEKLHLQHLFFDIRIKVDCRNKEDNQNANSIQAIVKDALDDYDQRKGEEIYFSKPQLIKLLNALGMKLIEQNTRTTDYDASQTVFYTFKKIPNFTPKVKPSLSAFEEKDLDQFKIKFEKDKNLDTNLKFFKQRPHLIESSNHESIHQKHHTKKV